jgi:ABC-type Fe3+-siderophore transport system permease subunit
LPEATSEAAPSLSAVLFGSTGGVNWVAVALFVVAGVCVVFIIFAIIKKASGSSDHKKYDDDNEDDYEKF